MAGFSSWIWLKSPLPSLQASQLNQVTLGLLYYYWYLCICSSFLLSCWLRSCSPLTFWFITTHVCTFKLVLSPIDCLEWSMQFSWQDLEVVCPYFLPRMEKSPPTDFISKKGLDCTISNHCTRLFLYNAWVPIIFLLVLTYSLFKFYFFCYVFGNSSPWVIMEGYSPPPQASYRPRRSSLNVSVYVLPRVCWLTITVLIW